MHQPPETRNFGRSTLVAIACGLCCIAVMLLAAGGISAVAGILTGSVLIMVATLSSSPLRSGVCF
jgi:hypothetical protein